MHIRIYVRHKQIDVQRGSMRGYNKVYIRICVHGTHVEGICIHAV